MKLKILIVSIFLSLSASWANSQSKHTISLNTDYLDAHKVRLKPGDTLHIEGGKRRYLQLKNIEGDSLSPIVIIPSGEVIIENSDFPYGLKLVDCKFFRLSGSIKGQNYGIRILQTGPGASGLSIEGKSSNFEVDHIEVCSTGFAGIMSKADPACDNSLNRDNFVQSNISFHHNYVHDVGGEGFYIGNSFYSGYSKNKNCPGQILFPHEIKGLKIFDNRIENTGWDGLQIGCATENVKVYNNIIINYGTKSANAQNNGLQIGEGSSGNYYNNLIIKGTGNGIIALGLGNIVIKNNYIYMPGESGIFCDDRITPKGNFMTVSNNSVINPGQNGFRWYNEKTKNIFKQNLIIIEQLNPQYFYFQNPMVKHESADNFTADNLSELTEYSSFVFVQGKKSGKPKHGIKPAEIPIISMLNMDKNKRPTLK